MAENKYPVLDNICPLTFGMKEGPYNCAKEKCAWWVEVTETCKNCSIKDIALSLDNLSTSRD